MNRAPKYGRSRNKSGACDHFTGERILISIIHDGQHFTGFAIVQMDTPIRSEGVLVKVVAWDTNITVKRSEIIK